FKTEVLKQPQIIHKDEMMSETNVADQDANPNIEELANEAEDQESGKRILTGWLAIAANIIAFVFGVFQYLTGGIRPLNGIRQSVLHLIFTLVLVYIFTPAVKKTRKWLDFVDLVLVFLALISLFYVLRYSDNIINLTYKNNNLQIIFGTILILLILEASRRVIGWTFPSMVGVLFLYAFFGHLIPGVFGHRKFSPAVIIRILYFDPQGMWGQMLQLSATLLGLFLVFGAVMLKTGGGEAFLNLASFLTARSRGGSAKVSTITSCLFGMISGSSNANAATIGTLTIPLMIKSGFTRNFAAAVESVAGTGGMLMPPVMGAGAFIMAQIIGVKYTTIALAALIPALMYYASLFISIHLEAIKKNMRIPSKEEFEAVRSHFSIQGTLLPILPIILLLAIFILGFTVQMAAYYSIILALVIMILTRGGKFNWEYIKKCLKGLYEAFGSAGISIMRIAVLISAAQIMISLLAMTGIAVKFSNIIVQLGQSNTFLTLIMGMILMFLLGLGVPATAAYVVGAAVVVPAFILLGLDTLAAHLFTFYFGALGAITPPVCGTVFISASIAKSDWWKSGWLAVRLGLPAFFVPFVLMYKQTLLLHGSPLSIIIDCTLVLIGITMLAAGGVGYFLTKATVFERVIFYISGFLLIMPNYLIASSGIVVGIIVCFIQYRRKKRG
ncbi:MAG: TRAP transporter fused permease subunit, partial [Spirochaetales bacterium]|nr:TRAP transporter fused permease subunit [Spirochaetales bacterium]